MSAIAKEVSENGIPGYRVSAVLYHSGRISVYRAIRESDNRPVIVKALNPSARGADNLSLHARERDIVRLLGGKGAVALSDGATSESSPVIEFEDFGGESLKSLARSRPFALPECLALGVKIADALASVHAAGVIHKDINPSNIAYNPKTDELRIIDFGSATSLAREQPSLGSPDVLEGTLAYISPEQTGRMNRSIDYRADFYSFGVSLYELLTGRLPFEESDPLSLVHAHLAKEPASPSSVAAHVPPAVSAIVLKLLAKMAEDRYQSALGIKHDLDECRRQLKEAGEIHVFPLGRFDASDALRLSQRLYGREAELETLLASFERAAGGGREIAMVIGYSGIGKTSLVRELYKPITARRGYFISGKFDQLQRNVPYKAIINAFQELTRQLLGENEKQLAGWKEKLAAALGGNGRIIIDIIPEIELILGPQPPLPALDPVQEQNRFNLALANFIRVFCRLEHPLTVYLDDLQWIDPASLKLLTHLIGDPSLRHLFFVGAYRDNEVNAAHPLMDALDRLQKSGALIHTLTLHPLKAEHVRQMVADTICMPPAAVEPLADLILKKTGGNPFFTEEFVKSLHADRLLEFDRQKGAWHWDLREIEAKGFSDNVVDLMVAKLKRLEPETQKALQLAACIGNQFDAATLSVIYQKSLPETMAALQDAIAAELVIPIGTSLSWSPSGDGELRVVSRFAHDRIQHAAYILIPEAQRMLAHLEIGRLLMHELSKDDRQEQLFEIVNHLNIGLPLITEEAEKESLVDLNLEAARRARRSNAYDAALNYFQTGLTLLGEAGWQHHYGVALAMHTEGAHAALLARNFDAVDALVDRAIANAKTLLDSIDAYAVRIESLIAQIRMADAATLGFRVLKLLGVSFPAKCDRRRLMFEYWRVKLALWGKSTDALLNAPLMRDPERLAEMRIIPHVLTATYFTMPMHTALIAMRAVRISARYGNTPFSAFAYASYGTFLCTTVEQMAEGRKFGELALALVDRLNAVGLKAKVIDLVYGLIFHWTEHLRAMSEPLAAGVRAGLEYGDLEFAAHCTANHIVALFHSALSLSDIDVQAKRYRGIAKGLTHTSLFIRRQCALNLMGRTEDPCELKGEAFDETESLPRLLKQKEAASMLAYYPCKIILAFLFERYPDALRYNNEFKKWLRLGIGLGLIAPHFFFEALVKLAAYADQSPVERKQTLEAVDGIYSRLRAWARYAPMNLSHRLYLIDAERARVLRQHQRAAECYDLAIAAAKKNEYVGEEAIAYELAGKFYLTQDRAHLAYGCLREARDAYARWGAAAKVKHLERKYPALIEGRSGMLAASDVGSTIVTDSFSMDLKGLMRALKDIASEQIHTQLLEKIITVAMEVAGAQKALLFLRNDADGLVLEAEADAARGKPEILKSLPLNECQNACAAVIHYVARVKQTVVIHDAQKPQGLLPGLHQEPYIRERGVKSLLCIPIFANSGESEELIGVLYLENNAATHTFVERVQEPLEIICLSAAGRLELSRKAVTDLLTKLYNHDYMQGILQKEVSLAARTGRKVSLVMIDIDHFKKFNDTYGHQAGDFVLANVAQVIKANTRQSDVVARYGGEEMAVVLPDTEQNVAHEVAERIRRSIETSVMIFEQKDLHVTASMGVATYGPGTADPKALVKAADRALYKSKHAGRNRVTAAEGIEAA